MGEFLNVYSTPPGGRSAQPQYRSNPYEGYRQPGEYDDDERYDDAPEPVVRRSRPQRSYRRIEEEPYDDRYDDEHRSDADDEMLDDGYEEEPRRSVNTHRGSQPARSVARRQDREQRRPAEEPEPIDDEDDEENIEDEYYPERNKARTRAVRYLGVAAVVWLSGGATYAGVTAGAQKIGFSDQSASPTMIVTGPIDGLSSVNNDLVKPFVGVGSTGMRGGLSVMSFIKKL